KSYWLRPMVEVGSVTHVLVGVGSEARGDLSGIWPTDQVLTDAELALAERRREDSLRALADSVAILRALLAAPLPLRDSVLGVYRAGRPLPVLLVPEAGDTTGRALPGAGGAPV